jgi:hypothetical protein
VLRGAEAEGGDHGPALVGESRETLAPKLEEPNLSGDTLEDAVHGWPDCIGDVALATELALVLEAGRGDRALLTEDCGLCCTKNGDPAAPWEREDERERPVVDSARGDATRGEI